MKLDELCRYVKRCREIDMTYQQIADDLHVSKAMARLLEQGHKPGPEVSAKLGLEPSAKVLRDRARRKKQRDEYKEFHIPEYNPKECRLCYGRMVIEKAMRMIEKIPEVGTPFYDDEIGEIINTICNSKSMWQCMCEDK